MPDQFSFFNPHYSPGGAHSNAGLLSPEAELLNMKYIIGGQNALYQLVQFGLSACSGGLGQRWDRGVDLICGSDNNRTYRKAAGNLAFSPDSSASSVVDQLATLLTADRLCDANRFVIEGAYSASYTAGGAEEALQVAQVLMLTVSFLVGIIP